jgi:PEP-CTERM motif
MNTRNTFLRVAAPVAAAALLAAPSAPARAQLVLYSSEAGLVSATGATGPINPPITGLTTAPIVAGPLSFTRGVGVGALAVNPVVGAPYSPALGVGNDQSFSNINVDFSAPAKAYGFGISSFHSTAFGDGTSVFSVSLFAPGGSAPFDGFTFAAPSASSGSPASLFVGFRSAAPFGRVELVETSGGPQNATPTGGLADREFFGGFYYAAAPVPEPGSIALAGFAGLAVVGVAHGRRRVMGTE